MSGLASQARYAALFASESRTQLATAVDGLTALARAVGDGAVPDAEVPNGAVDAVFRAVHSLKGMAAAMEYAGVESLAHEVETALARVRDGTLTPGTRHVDALIAAVDALANATDAAVAGREADVASAVSRLRAELASDGKPATPEPPSAAVAASARGDQPPPAAPSAQAAQSLSHVVRVDRARLDALLDVAGELTLARARLADVASRFGEPTLAAAVAEVARLVGVLHEEVRVARTAPASEVFERLPRVVRDVARGVGKRAQLVMSGGNVALDRAVLEELTEPLVHLLRNAVDHGIETPEERAAAGKPATGRIVLGAARDGDAVLVTVRDDGRGIDRARVTGDPFADDATLLAVLARPGFTTARAVTNVSGRGVGVDAVQDRLRRIGGKLELSTTAGAGTCFTMRLPLTLALGRALVAHVGGERYALPIGHVRETAEVPRDAIARVDGREVVWLRDEPLPAVWLDDRLAVASRTPDASNACGPLEVAVVESAGRRAALLVDAIDGQQELVVKRLPSVRGAFRFFGGATILADGTPALVLDVPAFLTPAEAGGVPPDRTSA